jgi:hypothetical protein
MEQDLEMGEAAAPRTAADTLRRWLANEPAIRVIYDGMERIGRPIDLLEQALAEAAAPTSPDVVEWFVHNHGPSEGKGTACHEYRVNGRLLGECLLPAQPAGLDVWAVVVGNYFPREVEAIYLHEADAVRHADEHDGRDVVKWTVAAAYAATDPDAKEGQS